MKENDNTANRNHLYKCEPHNHTKKIMVDGKVAEKIIPSCSDFMQKGNKLECVGCPANK